MKEITSLTKQQIMSEDFLQNIIKERSIIQVAFIQHITALFKDFSDQDIRTIDEVCHFSDGINPETKVGWIPLAFKTKIPEYLNVIEQRAQDFLSSIGRGKYVYPLFKAYTQALPRDCWEFYIQVKNTYHPLVQKGVADIITRPSQVN